MRKNIVRTRNLVFVTGLIFVVALAFPGLGVFTAIELASLFGCHLSAAGYAECVVFGIDWGERLYAYMIPVFGVLFTPLVFILFFYDFVFVWMLSCLVLHVLAVVKLTDPERFEAEQKNCKHQRDVILKNKNSESHDPWRE